MVFCWGMMGWEQKRFIFWLRRTALAHFFIGSKEKERERHIYISAWSTVVFRSAKKVRFEIVYSIDKVKWGLLCVFETVLVGSLALSSL